MLHEAINLTIPTHPLRDDWVLRNSIAECTVLHTRNLCDFCTSTLPTDIKPSDLYDNYGVDPEYKELRRLMRRLRQKYGTNNKGCVRWAFNKKLAHPTKGRGKSFSYLTYLNRVTPVLRDIITEIERLEGLSGRKFPP